MAERGYSLKEGTTNPDESFFLPTEIRRDPKKVPLIDNTKNSKRF